MIERRKRMRVSKPGGKVVHLKPYFVVWNIEIDAESPQDAAKRALDIQRDPRSIFTVFEVYPGDVKLFGATIANSLTIDAEEVDD
jgi:hypothetical protein